MMRWDVFKCYIIHSFEGYPHHPSMDIFHEQWWKDHSRMGWGGYPIGIFTRIFRDFEQDCNRYRQLRIYWTGRMGMGRIKGDQPICVNELSILRLGLETMLSPSNPVFGVWTASSSLVASVNFGSLPWKDAHHAWRMAQPPARVCSIASQTLHRSQPWEFFAFPLDVTCELREIPQIPGNTSCQARVLGVASDWVSGSMFPLLLQAPLQDTTCYCIAGTVITTCWLVPAWSLFCSRR